MLRRVGTRIKQRLFPYKPLVSPLKQNPLEADDRQFSFHDVKDKFEGHEKDESKSEEKAECAEDKKGEFLENDLTKRKELREEQYKTNEACSSKNSKTNNFELPTRNKESVNGARSKHIPFKCEEKPKDVEGKNDKPEQRACLQNPSPNMASDDTSEDKNQDLRTIHATTEQSESCSFHREAGTPGSDSDSETSTNLSDTDGQVFDREDPTRFSRISQSVPDLRTTLPSVNYYDMRHCRYLQVASDSGHGNSSQNMTILSSDPGESQKIIEARTENMMKNIKLVRTKVQTEIYKKAEYYLARRHTNKLVILKGSKVGCKFAAKMLLYEILEEDPDTKPYFIESASEWFPVDTENKTVFLLSDISGTTCFLKERLDVFFRLIENVLPQTKSDGKVTVIATMKDFSDEDISYVSDKYKNYIIFAKNYRPSFDTKLDLVRSFKEQYGRKVDRQTVNDIASLLGSVDYVRKLEDFFSGNVKEGTLFFQKPTKDYVTQFRQLADSHSESFVTLLAVFCHKGSLSCSDIDTLDELQHAFGGGDKMRFSFPNGLDRKPGEKKRNRPKSRHSKSQFETELALIFKYAKKTKLTKLSNLVQEKADVLCGTLLDYSEEKYSFASKNIENSFTVVCAEMFPEVLEW